MATNASFQSFEMAGPLSGGGRCMSIQRPAQQVLPFVLFKRMERTKRFSHRLAACRQSWE